MPAHLPSQKRRAGSIQQHALRNCLCHALWPSLELWQKSAKPVQQYAALIYCRAIVPSTGWCRPRAVQSVIVGCITKKVVPPRMDSRLDTWYFETSTACAAKSIHTKALLTSSTPAFRCTVDHRNHARLSRHATLSAPHGQFEGETYRSTTVVVQQYLVVVVVRYQTQRAVLV